MQTYRAVSGIVASFSKGFVSEVLLPTTFGFFLVFYSLCVYSFPWMLSHDNGIFNILGFLLRPRLYLYSSSERFLRGVLQGLSHHLPYNKWPQLVSETSWEEPMTSPVLHRFVPYISITWVTPSSEATSLEWTLMSLYSICSYCFYMLSRGRKPLTHFLTCWRFTWMKLNLRQSLIFFFLSREGGYASMVLILTITPSFSGQALAATLSFLVLPFLFKLDDFHFLESYFSFFPFHCRAE